MFHHVRKMLTLLLVGAALLVEKVDATPTTIVVGNDPDQPNLKIGWMDGACYLPIENVRVGDMIQFDYQGHNVYKMKDRRSYEQCDFRDAVLLADMEASPYFYEVMESDLQQQQSRDGGISELYFACKVGSHCQGQQRVRVRVNGTTASAEPREQEPVSKYALGVSSSACDLVQRNDADPSILERAMESSCSEPVPLSSVPDNIQYDPKDPRPWLFTTCLSPPVTLTPGGVINQATVLHFPYPTDRRVLMGSRIWEFVANEELVPVNVNQLYVHHILGGVVMGNGAESIRRSDEDAAFPTPYGRLSGDFNDIMTFHLIDIREVDQWLECVECRCRDVNGTYLDIGGAGEGEAGSQQQQTSVARSENDESESSDDDDEEDPLGGGISCCSNCTTLTTPTVDYRLRYNVTYMDIAQQDQPVEPIVMLSADIAPAVLQSIEFDVPEYTDLPANQRLPEDPTIQVLERVGKVRNLFRNDFFGAPYSGPDEIEIHRCTGHMHIGALAQWVEDARTGEIICHNKAVYGIDPTADKGFVTSISVKNYEEDGPMVLSADKRVRLITHYNASIVHTGVMGMFFLFVSEYEQVTADKAALVVDVCSAGSCNASMLPRSEDVPICEDDLGFFCRFLGVCDCETFLEREQVTGCGGVVMTGRGNFSVDRFCAKTCGCKHLEREGAKEEVMREGIEKAMQSNVSALCHYSSKDCHHYLSNIYSCAAEKPGSEDLDDFVMSMMLTKGRRMALDYAKLGDRAIHRFDAVLRDEFDVPTCVEEDPYEEDSSALTRYHGSSLLILLLIGIGSVFFF